MKTIRNILLTGAIVLSSFSCTNKPNKEASNLGVAEVPLILNGKQVTGQIIDIDNDSKADGVLVNNDLGNTYLLKYQEGYQNSSEFRNFYDPQKSKPFEKGDRKKLSTYLLINKFLEENKK